MFTLYFCLKFLYTGKECYSAGLHEA